MNKNQTKDRCQIKRPKLRGSLRSEKQMLRSSSQSSGAARRASRILYMENIKFLIQLTKTVHVKSNTVAKGIKKRERAERATRIIRIDNDPQVYFCVFFFPKNVLALLEVFTLDLKKKGKKEKLKKNGIHICHVKCHFTLSNILPYICSRYNFR